MTSARTAPGPAVDVAGRIRIWRGHRVLIDSDLAALYGVATARLNQQFRRNRDRFPADFAFEVSSDCAENLMLQSATSSSGHGGRRKATIVFTEHGAIMAATILNSPRAVQMTVFVVRAFVRARELMTSHTQLAKELSALKESVSALDADTRRQFEIVHEAILGLMGPRPGRQ
jgi:ORF6N domain